MTVGLPTPMSVRTLLADLLGRDITLSPSTPFAPGLGHPASLAVYVDDSLQIRAVIAVDLPLSAYIGAAIGLIPVGGADDSIEAKSLAEALTANLYEVLNIAASLFNLPGMPHMRLYALHAAGTPMPPDIQARAVTLGQREDLEVAISAYGSGQLSIVLT